MKILVTGASGLLGLNLSLLMHGAHEIVGVDRNKLIGTPFELIKADLLDDSAVNQLVVKVRPEAVIHTAAIANIDMCEVDPTAARRLNAELPGELAQICKQRGIRLIHISTDAVFDGTRREAYTELDAPNPLGVYARTKLEGELAVQAVNENAIVARVNFFGWSLSGGRSLSEYFYYKLKKGEQCHGFRDVSFCPMYVGDLADILIRMLEEDLSGLYHVVGSEAITKYDFGVMIAHRFGFDAGLIAPISVEESDLKARRSHNLKLSIHKLSTALDDEIPDVSTGIERFYTHYQQGYPQKIKSYQQV